jgi:2-polyprenyl-3-methyl-5-hydroxy-6-metoxy-1,4-benzoquinol methylase
MRRVPASIKWNETVMETANNNTPVQLGHFLSRVDFLRDICRNKRVLDLGCSSGQFIQDRLNRGSLLHAILQKEARALYGMDLDGASLAVMRDLGFGNLYEGNAENLDELNLDETFDVVLAGDLLEHVTRPGAMLDGIKRFMHPVSGQFVVSTPNAFGLNFQIRRWMGNYTEHPEHVCFYSPETPQHLLERHGYHVQEMQGCYTEPPHTWKRKIEFAVGSPLFRMAPVLAGTLIAVARLNQHPEEVFRAF